jgi:hypothetical protein
MTITKKNRELIVDSHNVVRYLKPRFLIRDDFDEDIISIFSQAFELRPNEEFLSVNWLEYFELPNKKDALKLIINDLKASNLPVGSKGALAIANISKIKSIGKDRKTKIRVEYRPNNLNKSHSRVFNIQNEDLEMLDLLSREAFSEIIPIDKLTSNPI